MKLQFNSGHKFLILQVFLGLVFLALLAHLALLVLLSSVLWWWWKFFSDQQCCAATGVSKHQFSFAKRPFSQFALANFNQAYFGPIVNGFWLIKSILMMMKVCCSWCRIKWANSLRTIILGLLAIRSIFSKTLLAPL